MGEAEVLISERKKLAIIDGKSVFYRGYYAMPGLSTKDGTPTGGVYGFATMALEVLKRLNPDYVCVAWDKPKTNIRKRLELYPEYKAGRKPAPPDFKAQIPLLHELLEAFGWPLYELDDYEADDIMGTLAVQAKEKNIETLLITSDLDMLQLVNSHVHVYALKKGLSNIELFRPESFILKYGIKPEQFLDLKALKGDSSDNIPGVPGIGEKGALELIKEYKTLDGVYENTMLVKEALKKKLELGKDSAYLSKKLAAIWTDAPIKLDLKKVDGSNCKPQQIKEILQRLEFRTLVRQLPEIMKVDSTSSLASTSDLKIGEQLTINNEAGLELMQIKDAKKLYIYSRSKKAHGLDTELLILATSQQTYAIHVDKISHQKLAVVLSGILEDPRVAKIGYDLKTTIKACLSLGISLEGVAYDVLVGSYLLNSLRREQTLTELAQADIGYDGTDLEDTPTDELAERSAEVIAIIKQLYKQQADELKLLPKVAKLAVEIEWPSIPVLAAMEYEGIQLDTSYLNMFSDQLADAISDLEQQIYGLADQEFNISSPHQLSEILFDKLKLSTAGVKKGKTGYSTAAKELDKLRGEHAIVDFITQYREATKLKNTYVDTLPTMVDENSRLHTTYNITMAQTGRLSSEDPNLQNIPVRTELGKHIRTAFVAGKGKRLVSADYSQFELRLAAYLSGDNELMKTFNNGADIHTMTASQVYEREPEDVTKQMRRDAKIINFGVMYGMSPHGLSMATGMTYDAAQKFIDKYFEIRAPLLSYMNSLKEKARKDGYVETLFGRRRPMPDIKSSNFAVRMAAERAAINMPIQGTEADLMKLAMIEIAKRLDKTSGKMLLQVHDSILVECLEEEAKKVAELLRDCMENVYKLPVKLDVDTSIGQNWGEL